VWQKRWFDTDPEIRDLGPFDDPTSSLRAWVDRRTIAPEPAARPEAAEKLGESRRKIAVFGESGAARMRVLREVIERVSAGEY
jgi:hypothetical protein